METPEKIREKIKKLIFEKGSNLREASLIIGRKDSYLHQYVNYGYPLRLKESDRKKLSVFLGVPEQELTDLDLSALALPVSISGTQALAGAITSGVSSLIQKFAAKKDDIISIDMLDATACCGSGIENLTENISGKWLMPLVDFRQISMSSPENIKLLKVKGDSMVPTLKEDDWVMVDITKKSPDSDGLFLLILANGLAVKRVQCGLGNNITVLSDNPKYAPLPATLEEVPIAGKVIYTLTADKVG